MYGAANIVSNLIIAGVGCGEIFDEATNYLEFLKSKADVGLNSFFIPGGFCALLNLQGKTRSRTSFDCEYLNESVFIKTFSKLPIVEGWFYAVKIRSLYFYRCFEEGVKIIPKAEIVATGVPGQIKIPEAYFYSCLMFASTHQVVSDSKTLTYYWGLFEKYKGFLKLWADCCPENFLHKYYLIEAGQARMEKRSMVEALTFYDKAIQSAKENNYLNNMALARELKGRFWIENGQRDYALIEVREAVEAYQNWGATGKVEMLQEEFPELVRKRLGTSFSSGAQTNIFENASLDLLSVHKASQLISGKINLGELIPTMMGIIIENAGAERGVLILKKDERWFVKAEATVEYGTTLIAEAINLNLEQPSNERPKLPLMILNYVIRTQSSLMLDAAVRDNRFGKDFYITTVQAKSILCLPLFNLGRMMGIIYLENNLNFNVFDISRQEVMKLLAGQIAISLDNAMLYELSQDSIRSRDDFLSMASHELKTPLTPLKMYIQLVKKWLSKLPPDVAPNQELLVKAIESTDRECSRLSKLIDDLLDVSRISTGRLLLDPKEFDLAEVVSEMLGRFSEEFRKTRSELKVDLQANVRGHWDRLRIEQVITNIFTNAIKYAPGKPIEIGVVTEGKMAKLIVRDHGIGIANEDQPRIFDRYERAVSIQDCSGLGLGLYIANRIVIAHHGSIDVESELGKGTTFTVKLPLSGNPA